MALIKFMEKAGNYVWINEDAVDAVGLVYSDGTETGENPDAKPLTYVLLRSGATIHLERDAEQVANLLKPA